MARDGSSGVEKTFNIRSRPASVQTQSVKVPPVSTATRSCVLPGSIGFLFFVEALCHEESVNLVLVITRKGLYDEVTEAFIEFDSCLIIHGSFEENAIATAGGEFRFRRVHQQSAHAGATEFRRGIDGDYVSHALRMSLRNDEPGNRWWLTLCFSRTTLGGRFSDQRKRSAHLHVMREFPARVCDARRKTFLVEFEQALEVTGLKVAQVETHVSIVMVETVKARNHTDFVVCA